MSPNVPVTTPQQLADLLRQHEARIVFAESCTAGLAAAELGGIAGISEFLCGSAVTYRDRTKIEWLRVSAETIADQTAVSADVAAQMARGALQVTSEATLAVSITGHLGPGAPAELDGRVFVASAVRSESGIQVVRAVERTLDEQTRRQRQHAAVVVMFQEAAATLENRS